MSAAERLLALDSLPAADLCSRAEASLSALAAAMNDETTMLRAGRYGEAEPLAARKALLSQDYVALARAVQRQHLRLKAEAPDAMLRLRGGHDMLATQMAENLRVLATARSVAETLLSDLAGAVAKTARPRTYGALGVNGASPPPQAARGLAMDRAL